MTESWRTSAATSQKGFWRLARKIRGYVRFFSLPNFAPYNWLVRLLSDGIATTWRAAIRVIVAEPYLKAHCRRVGRRVHTDCFLHWIQGNGVIEIGDDVLLDGKSSIAFTSRYAAEPTLRIGNRCYIGHGCRFIVGRSITIGSDVRLAAGVTIREASGHPLNPALRAEGQAAPPDSVRPITIEDGAWIGADATILAGVRVGQGAVVATCAVVTRDVPPNTVAAGNPARIVREEIDRGTG